MASPAPMDRIRIIQGEPDMAARIRSLHDLGLTAHEIADVLKADPEQIRRTLEALAAENLIQIRPDL